MADSAGLEYGTRQGRWVIAAAVLGSGIVSLDATAMSVALPSVGRSLHVGLSTLQWVVTGYSLTLAGFLLLGGSLGDRYGRRRIYAIGVVWFAVASVASGLAQDAFILVVARVAQGIGGALLTPASLAILEASFRRQDRSRAIGAWSGLGGLASAAGPLVGGYLIAVGSWRWVFFINVPVAVSVLAFTLRHVPESRDPAATGRVDGLGAAMAVIILTGLTYSLIEGPAGGWSAPLVVGCFVVVALTIPVFAVTEGRRRRPMLPLSMFTARQFSAVNAVTFVMYGGLYGALFLLPVELQVVKGYSPFRAGLALLPITALLLVFSPRSARLASRIGPRLQMTVGPGLSGAGLFLLVRATSGSYEANVLPALLLFGTGLTVTVAPLTSAAMAAAPAEHAGMASAVNNVVSRTAGLLAVAVLPLLAGLTGSAALRPHEFAAGFRVAMVISGGAFLGAGLVAVMTVSNRRG